MAAPFTVEERWRQQDRLLDQALVRLSRERGEEPEHVRNRLLVGAVSTGAVGLGGPEEDEIRALDRRPVVWEEDLASAGAG